MLTAELCAFFRTHRRSSLALVVFFTVFFNCFSFPLLNLTSPGRSGISVFTPLALIFWVLPTFGAIAAVIFPRCGVPALLSGMFALSLIGLGCRLVMEWGEVSIQTDFTALNTIAHLVLMHLPIGAGCLRAKSFES